MGGTTLEMTVMTNGARRTYVIISFGHSSGLLMWFVQLVGESSNRGLLGTYKFRNLHFEPTSPPPLIIYMNIFFFCRLPVYSPVFMGMIIAVKY